MFCIKTRDHKVTFCHRWIICTLIFCCGIASSNLTWGQVQPKFDEAELIALLQSEASEAERAMACKQLAVVGSSASVYELAKLLTDPHLASWARIALEAIPGSEAEQALIGALALVEGDLQIGVINSLAVRRTTGADEVLIKLIGSEQVGSDVRASAAVALGRIGGSLGVENLQSYLSSTDGELRAAAAEGCVYAAEIAFKSGDVSLALKIYEQVRQADVPTFRLLEATRGAIVVQGEQGIPLLIEQLRSENKLNYQLGLSTLREIAASPADTIILSELQLLSPERVAMVLQALVERPGAIDPKYLLEIANTDSIPVRVSAVQALGKVGDISSVETLIAAGASANEELAKAAVEAATRLSGESIDQDLVRRLPEANIISQKFLLEVIGLRQINAVDDITRFLKSENEALRAAALTALGRTVPAERLSILIEQVRFPFRNTDLPAAVGALKMAVVRMPDREACSAELTSALERSSGDRAAFLLEAIGSVGGTQSLATIAKAAKGSDAELQNIATRILGEWMTIDAAPVIFELAQSLQENKYQVRVVRAYLRMARQFSMSSDERDEMCRLAREICKQPAEKKLWLEILARYPTPDTLRMAAAARQDSELTAEATSTVLSIAQKLGANPNQLEELLGPDGLDSVKLEILHAEYGAGESQKDVTQILQQHAKDRVWVVLPSSNYNSAFDGDPAPGVPKQLKVKYRLNGNEKASVFDENAVIILTESR